MASASSKVLIIGIDGFTGKHLKSYFEKKGYEVFGTVLGKSSSSKHFSCDIRKDSDIQKVIEQVQPDYILHLAAISFVGESDSSLIYDVNVIGTQNILDAVIKAKLNPKKIIIASSATVYGNQGKEVLDESMCPKPVNHYGISKLAMEHMVSTYFDKLDIIVTRPFNYTGVGQAEHFLIPKIVKHYREKKDIIELGNLDVIREFNDIEYVCEIYQRIFESVYRSKIINICSSRGIQLLDVIEEMNNISGYKITVKVNPAFVRKDEIKTLIGSTKELFLLMGEISQKPFNQTLRELYEA